MSSPLPRAPSELIGHLVVVDVTSPYVIVGRLVGEQPGFLVLDDVDVHDLRDTAINREQYVLNACAHGVRPNRRRSWVNLQEVVAISRLDEVVLD